MFLRVNFKYAHATQEGVVDSSIEIKAEQIKCDSQVGRRRFSWRRRAIVSSPVTRHTVTLHCHLDLDATQTRRRGCRRCGETLALSPPSTCNESCRLNDRLRARREEEIAGGFSPPIVIGGTSVRSRPPAHSPAIASSRTFSHQCERKRELCICHDAKCHPKHPVCQSVSQSVSDRT